MTQVSKNSDMHSVLSSVRKDYQDTMTSIMKNSKRPDGTPVDAQEATNAWILKKIGEFEIRLTVLENRLRPSTVSKKA